MSWELLPVNFTDAVWSGLKRFNEITNEDGTVSFQDVTLYSNKENSFFSAKDANRMNEAMNAIMSMVENGTDLYTAFQNYFEAQKALFEETARDTQTGFGKYVKDLRAQGDKEIETIKTDYRNEVTTFEKQQEELFTMWFNFIKGQFAGDVAGNLQNQINYVERKTDGFVPKQTVFAKDGKTITETSGDDKIVTVFESDTRIVQKLYNKDVLSLTKVTTFNADGEVISEEVS